MKKTLLLFIILLVAVVSHAGTADNSSPVIRKNVSINSHWEFIRDDWEQGKKETVLLPHSYNVQECMDGYDYYRGRAEYQRILLMNELDSGLRTFIRFGSVSLTSKIYINNVLLGEHRGGFAAFIFELTQYLKYDGKDLIQVMVSNKKAGDVMPVSGDFNVYGGMTRGVELIQLPLTAISPLHYASSGVYISQQKITDKEALLSISVRTLSNQTKEGMIVLKLTDANGAVVSEKQVKSTFAKGENSQLPIQMKVKNPILWQGIENPYLYQLEVLLYSDSGMLLDQLIESTGFRYYSVDPQKGFFLNGKSLKLRGVNRHQDFEGRGAALLPADHQLDMEIIKEMGTNALRLAHYQHDQLFYQLADQEGMVVWAEIPFVSFALEKSYGLGKRKGFLKNGINQLSELIYQNYNHPSICFWGIYNEIKNLDAPASLVKKLNEHAKNIDPYRLTTGAANLGGPFNDITDILAWNKYAGWYAGLPGTFTRWTDRYHNMNPDRSFGISEYGAGASAFQHQTQLIKSLPGSSWHPENWQCEYHEQYWKTIRDRDFIWGSFLWNMFDFSIVNRNEGDHKGRNDKGMVTYDRKVKKDVFYFYKAAWSNKPVLYITQRRFTKRQEASTVVKVYTNQNEVELFVNDISLGEKNPDDLGIIRWVDVTLKSGTNKVEVQSIVNGVSLMDEVEWILK